MTLAELKRDAASGKMRMEMIERYGKPPAENSQGFRPIVKVSSKGICFKNNDGKESWLNIDYVSLVEYSNDKTTLTVYNAGLRPLNAAEKAKLAAWEEIANRPENVERDRIAARSDGMGTFYMEKDFFNGEFEYLFSEKNGKSILWKDGERLIRDPAVKGDAILKYRIEFEGESGISALQKDRQKEFLELGHFRPMFGIYQLKGGEDLREYRFENYETLTSSGKKVDKNNYNLVYAEPLTKIDLSLEEIYTRFNIDRPADFKRHSLSVSDVIVLKWNDDEYSAHYVDTFGFAPLSDFIIEKLLQNTSEQEQDMQFRSGQQLVEEAMDFIVGTVEAAKEDGEIMSSDWIDTQTGEFFVDFDDESEIVFYTEMVRGLFRNYINGNIDKNGDEIIKEQNYEIKGKPAVMYGGDGYLYNNRSEYTNDEIAEIRKLHPNTKIIPWYIDSGENKGKFFIRLDMTPAAEAEREKGIEKMDYKQIQQLKAQHKDALLFLRVGDFYELFDNDAVTVSKELDLTLTGRDMTGAAERVPMTGVPYHVLDDYIKRLVEKGFKIAVAESLEPSAPKQTQDWGDQYDALLEQRAKEYIERGLIETPNNNRRDYLAARLIAATVFSDFVNKEIDFMDARYVDPISDRLYYEKPLLKDMLSKLPETDDKTEGRYIREICRNFSEEISEDILEQYGWSQSSIYNGIFEKSMSEYVIQNNIEPVKGLLLKSPFLDWLSRSNETLPKEVYEAANWLIVNGYEKEYDVSSAFNQRQTSSWADFITDAEMQDNAAIMRVAGKYQQEKLVEAVVDYNAKTLSQTEITIQSPVFKEVLPEQAAMRAIRIPKTEIMMLNDNNADKSETENTALSYGELITISEEWEKWKAAHGADAGSAIEFAKNQSDGNEPLADDIFNYISVIEEPGETEAEQEPETSERANDKEAEPIKKTTIAELAKASDRIVISGIPPLETMEKPETQSSGNLRMCRNIAREYWGDVQIEEMLKDGVYCFNTAGHGGYVVDGNVFNIDRIPERFLYDKNKKFAVFEEDSDWAVLLYYYPEISEAYYNVVNARSLGFHEQYPTHNKFFADGVVKAMERCHKEQLDSRLRGSFEFNNKIYPTTDAGFEDVSGDISQMLMVKLFEEGLIVGNEIGNGPEITKIIKKHANEVIDDMRSADAFLFGSKNDGGRYMSASQFALNALEEIAQDFYGLDDPKNFSDAKYILTLPMHNLLDVIDGTIILPSERLAETSVKTETAAPPVAAQNINIEVSSTLMEDKKMNNTENVKANNINDDSLYGDGVGEPQVTENSAEAKKQGKLTPEDYVKMADADFINVMREGKYADIVDGIADLDYSVRNVMLIKSQLPGATNVANMKQWNYQKRSIIPGSKSIKILAYNGESANKSAENGGGENAAHDDNGNKDVSGKNYRISFVFDVSQTQGKDLREIRCTPEVLDKYYDGIKRTVANMAREFEFAEGEKNSVDFENKTINIQKGLSREDALKAMIAGVAAVHTESKARADGREISEGREMFNEIEEAAIAHIVSRRLGLGDMKLKTADFSKFDDESMLRVSGNLNNVRMRAQRIANAVEQFISGAQSADAVRQIRAAEAASAPETAGIPNYVMPQLGFKKVSEAT